MNAKKRCQNRLKKLQRKYQDVDLRFTGHCTVYGRWKNLFPENSLTWYGEINNYKETDHVLKWLIIENFKFFRY